MDKEKTLLALQDIKYKAKYYEKDEYALEEIDEDFETIRQALTQTARVDVDDRQLKEDVWKAIGKPSFSWGIISQTINYITARYSLVEKED